ncbi:MAG: sigma 54-interacting transcriptional regulator [Bacteroidales bacterium]|nr:sigma 54-interacting transcriptional regulator [Bacteroidales bacterium]
MKEFGINRVLEPKGAIPVTAWKLDNSKKIHPDEIRVSLEWIDFERDNMDQIAAVSEFDSAITRERIMTIIRERGKFHNPYTESSGVFYGTIEAAGKNSGLESRGLAVGDRVVGICPLAGLPMHIDEIEELDFNYSQMRAKGYVICFPSSKLYKIEDDVSVQHLLRALNEEGNFEGIQYELITHRSRKVAVIGSNLAEAVLYAHMVKKTWFGESTVTLIMDSSYVFEGLKEELFEIFGDSLDKMYKVNLSAPYDAAMEIIDQEKGELFDCTINLENITGCDSVTALITREKGQICFISMSNRYNQSMLATDSLGKEMHFYSMDGFRDSTMEFTMELVRDSEPSMKKLDSFYKKHTGRPGRPVLETVIGERTKKAAKSIDNFIYESPVTGQMVDEILNIARYDANVIIQGETGSGKEKVFDLILQNSPRRDKPAVKINCATIQENLAESEFFGYEKGSFTGASIEGKEGYFALANNGTLFLDEIGSLPLDMQAKLLRVLQENTFYRVGGTEPRHVNVRVICANNVPLKKLIEEGKFREDLYYRLNICQINVPPLRARKEDIVCLADAFLEGYGNRYGTVKSFSQDAYRELMAYHWPGNVRELENTVHRLYITEKTDIIDGVDVESMLNENVYDDVILDVKKEFDREEDMNFDSIMSRQEKRLIAFALKKEGTTRAAAQYLGMTQATLARKKLKYGL